MDCYDCMSDRRIGRRFSLGFNMMERDDIVVESVDIRLTEVVLYTPYEEREFLVYAQTIQEHPRNSKYKD